MKADLHGAVVAFGLVFAAGTGGVGCVKPVPHLAQGLAYTTGQGTYDDFFAAVLTLRAEGQKAREDEATTRAALTSMLGLEAKASATLAVSEAESRAKKLRDAGIAFHVDLVPETKVVTAKAKGVANVEADDLAQAAEASTKSALTLSQRLGAVSARAAELEKIRTDLRAQAPSTFRGEPQARRDEITMELDASAAVLTEASDAGERWGGVAAKFAIDLARALESSSVGMPDPTPVKAVKSPGPKPPAHDAVAVRPPTPAGATSTAPSPPPAKKPPPAAVKPPPAAKPAGKKPKGGDDFEP